MEIPPEGKTVVLARHGQTDFNIEGRVQDPISPHLTETGRSQARALGKEIDRLGLSFDAIVCADTSRNKETLREIYPEYEKMEHVKVDPRLQERYHKDLVGKTKTDIETELGEQLVDRLSWHLYFEGTDKSMLTGKKYPNNEPLESVRERLTSLLDDLKDKGAVLLIGSSVANQYILEYLQHGTMGVQRPQSPDGEGIDFQENDELRIVTIDESMKMKDYISTKY